MKQSNSHIMKHATIYIKPLFIIGMPVLFLSSILFSSCKKYLDQKPIKTQVVPSTLQDLQALLDHSQGYMNSWSPALLEMISDDYYITDATFGSYSSGSGAAQVQHYSWFGNAIPYSDSWIFTYQRPIYTSNVVLDQLQKIGTNSGEANTYNAIKGSALFYRAFYFE
jgi:starch-binding outer membrane protein, SusD/RagB family